MSFYKETLSIIMKEINELENLNTEIIALGKSEGMKKLKENIKQINILKQEYEIYKKLSFFVIFRE